MTIQCGWGEMSSRASDVSSQPIVISSSTLFTKPGHILQSDESFVVTCWPGAISLPMTTVLTAPDTTGLYYH